ncbi:hypothetical protein vBVpaMR16F_179 [Vibrio phage vB_VpaM_R16F]|nr:hypothetical protein vBVpaMR16F_179 [Vibrio phage vB_VpaM_R16F]
MSVFIIRNKETLEQWVASSGKRSWNKSNHAKAAFANSSGMTKRDPLLKEFVAKLSRYESLRFNNQDVYEVVELHSDAEKRADRNERILKEIIETFYGHGYAIANWHLNGELEPLDNFFDDNDWFVEE